MINYIFRENIEMYRPTLCECDELFAAQRSRDGSNQ